MRFFSASISSFLDFSAAFACPASPPPATSETQLSLEQLNSQQLITDALHNSHILKFTNEIAETQRRIRRELIWQSFICARLP